jgi:hypothetical protein
MDIRMYPIINDNRNKQGMMRGGNKWLLVTGKTTTLFIGL